MVKEIDLGFLIKKNAALLRFGINESSFLLNNSPALRQKAGIIYLIVNLVNGKIYVGQTMKTFNKRYRGGWWNRSTNEHLVNAAKKDGHTNFRIIILEENKNQADLDILETHYILSFQSYKDEYGYNKTLGGESNRQSPEVKQRRDIEKFNLIIQESKRIYGEGTFQYLEAKISDKSKIHLICNKCEYDFWQDVHFHLHRNRGCRKCSIKQQAINKTLTFDEFLDKAKQKHGDDFEYPDGDQYTDLKTRIPIKHKTCGQVFNVLPYNHLIQGCEFCRLKKLSARQSKNVLITTYNNQQFSFQSLKEAQKFINDRLGTDHRSGLRNQNLLSKGMPFNYKGFHVEVSKQRGG